jgi:hypothetical protein
MTLNPGGASVPLPHSLRGHPHSTTEPDAHLEPAAGWVLGRVEAQRHSSGQEPLKPEALTRPQS